jgi:hypothetical protein
VARDQVELEVEFVTNGPMSRMDKYRFHLRCFAAWEFERTEVEGPSEPPRVTR